MFEPAWQIIKPVHYWPAQIYNSDISFYRMSISAVLYFRDIGLADYKCT